MGIAGRPTDPRAQGVVHYFVGKGRTCGVCGKGRDAKIHGLKVIGAKA